MFRLALLSPRGASAKVQKCPAGIPALPYFWINAREFRPCNPHNPRNPHNIFGDCMVFSGVVWSTSRLHAKTVKSGYCLSIVTIALRRTLAGHFFTFADAPASGSTSVAMVVIHDSIRASCTHPGAGALLPLVLSSVCGWEARLRC